MAPERDTDSELAARWALEKVLDRRLERFPTQPDRESPDYIDEGNEAYEMKAVTSEAFRNLRPAEVAGMGATPASRAKAASERTRPRCDQVTITCAATIGPTPDIARRLADGGTSRDAVRLLKRYLARRGQVVLEVNADEVEDLARKGTRQARRGRRPKSDSN